MTINIYCALFIIFSFSGLAFGQEQTNHYVPKIVRIPAQDDTVSDGAVPSSEEKLSAEETPVEFEEIAGDKNLAGSRPWRAPDFSHQEGALGWTPTAFDVPKGLEVNVKFWLDIYTKYTTDQGVLHDADNIDLIYEVLDFTQISSRGDWSSVRKSLTKQKAVKKAKARIVKMLQKLQKTKDPSTLNEEEKRIWDYFESSKEKNKFVKAAMKNRLRFQLGQRDRIVQGIFFSGRYLEDFEKIFEEAGLPKELTRLPFVESSFNVLARSKVGASGLWQIMNYTGKPFMTINATIDKRNHPLEATKLAAKLLKYNYNMLESWPLAVTGWNHGPAGVHRLVKICKSRELCDLASPLRRKHLGFASRNFFPSFLAVLEAERNAPKYFGSVFWSRPLGGINITIKKPVKWADVLRWFDNDTKAAEIYNPHVTGSARKKGQSIQKNAILMIPASKFDAIQEELARVPEKPEKSKKSKIKKAKK